MDGSDKEVYTISRARVVSNRRLHGKTRKKRTLQLARTTVGSGKNARNIIIFFIWTAMASSLLKTIWKKYVRKETVKKKKMEKKKYTKCRHPHQVARKPWLV
uniref:Uncharacterized protein n=1 Tax=Plectus sambesii TaxID=2011161 RepID=A0A914VU99_9BILA